MECYQFEYWMPGELDIDTCLDDVAAAVGKKDSGMIDFTSAIEEGHRRGQEALKAKKESFEELKARMTRKLQARPPYPLNRKECDNCIHNDEVAMPECIDCENESNWKVDPVVLNAAHDEKMGAYDGDKKETVMASDDYMTAPEFLHKSAEIMEERGKTYDSEGGERSMGKCVTAFNAITGKDLKEEDGWLLLQLLKDVRQWSRDDYHADSAEDCIAYAALKAESL